jgi:hypothetical protein
MFVAVETLFFLHRANLPCKNKRLTCTDRKYASKWETFFNQVSLLQNSPESKANTDQFGLSGHFSEF